MEKLKAIWSKLRDYATLVDQFLEKHMGSIISFLIVSYVLVILFSKEELSNRTLLFIILLELWYTQIKIKNSSACKSN